MDFIHGLLIMEDDLDDDDNADNSTGDTTIFGFSRHSSNGTASPPWCNCSKCRVMPQDMEKRCCGQRRCLTTYARFTKLCQCP